MSEQEPRTPHGEQDDHESATNAPDGDGRREPHDGSRGAAESPAARDGSHSAPAHRSDNADTDDPEADGVVEAELLEVADEAKQVLSVLARQSFSGPIPRADDLHKYDEAERERIFRIAEAFSTDESKRRDVMVDSATTVAKRAQWISPILLIVGFGFSFVSYSMFENVLLSGLFLSIPVLRVIGTTVTSVVRQRQRDDDDDDE